MFVSTLEILASRRRDPLGVSIELSLTGTYYPLGFPPGYRDQFARCHPGSRGIVGRPGAGNLTCNRSSCACSCSRKAPLSQTSYPPQAGTPLFHRVGRRELRADRFALAIRLRPRLATRRRRTTRGCAGSSSSRVAYLMLGQRQVVMVHAGCVARNGSGVLLCGASESGKSTLAYACARAGWTWIADDCTCLLPDSPERIAIGRTRQARFRVDAPALFPELEQFTARERPTGKIGIEVDMSALPGIRTAARTPIGALAFLERRPGPAICATHFARRSDRSAPGGYAIVRGRGGRAA